MLLSGFIVVVVAFGVVIARCCVCVVCDVCNWFYGYWLVFGVC